MRVRVVDQLHVSAVSSDTMPKGTEFEVSEPLAKELEAKGLVVRVETAESTEPAPAPTGEKAELAPANKAEKPPLNKASGRKRG